MNAQPAKTSCHIEPLGISLGISCASVDRRPPKSPVAGGLLELADVIPFRTHLVGGLEHDWMIFPHIGNVIFDANTPVSHGYALGASGCSETKPGENLNLVG